ncbi:MAG TPA: protein phosphatase CheZ, partial [Gallionella sp.]|nr:protein phosphatase CheZ [Gallionella sp.]
MATNTATQDSDDLEALFDSIVAANAEETKVASAPAANAAIADGDPAKVINHIGQMARTLHDTLRELGLNKEIEKAAATIPDARDRLNY